MIALPAKAAELPPPAIDLSSFRNNVVKSPEQPAAAKIATKGKMPIRRIAIGFVAAAIFAFVILLVSRGARDQSGQQVAKPASRSTQIGTVTAVPAAKSKTDIARELQSDVRTRHLLSKVASLYAESPAKITQLVRLMIAEMGDAGQQLAPEEALEGSLRWAMPGYFSREKKSEFAEYFAFYLTLRLNKNKKMSHVQAIRQLHHLASALHLKSKQSTDATFEAVFEAASPGCQLAMAESHDHIRGDDPLAEYYGELADKVARVYGVTGKDVSGKTALAIIKAQLAEKSAHPDQILKAALGWKPLIESQTQGGNPPRLDTFLGLYLSLRLNAGKSHDQANMELCGQAPDDQEPSW